MISLVTGLPGSAKTQLIVSDLLDGLSSLNRPVYCNVNGLNHEKLLTFPLLEPTEWYELPEGSMIIIDEAQRWFPPRPNGSKVPKHVTELETHRHHGFDLVFITQHPSLLDSNLRKLTELHRHCCRPFGMQYRNILEFSACNDSPEPKQNESTQLKSRVPFRKDTYDLYKSSSQHTHKRRIPYKKLIYFALALLVVTYLIYSVYSTLEEKATVAPVVDVQEAAPLKPLSLDLPKADLNIDDRGHNSDSVSYSDSLDSVIAVSAPNSSEHIWLRFAGELRQLSSFYSYQILNNSIIIKELPESPLVTLNFPYQLRQSYSGF